MGGIIEPRDKKEAAAVGVFDAVAKALGFVSGAVVAVFGVMQGWEWLTSHIQLLCAGVAGLVSGAITTYVALRRMRMDKRGMTE